MFCFHISCSVIKSWSFTFESEIKEKTYCFSNLLPERHVAKILTFSCHCITARQWMVRYPFVHYQFFPYFIMGIYIFSCCTFSIFCSFYVVFFSYGITCMLNICVVIFSCCTFFVLHSFYVLHYLILIFDFYTLQCFRFSLFSCCTLRMLQFFLAAVCSYSTNSRGVTRASKNI